MSENVKPTTDRTEETQHHDVRSGEGTEEKEAREKEEKIKELEKQNRIYRGKLKGYQTLGQLFHEAKHECSQYKKQNGELQQQLRDLFEQSGRFGSGSGSGWNFGGNLLSGFGHPGGLPDDKTGLTNVGEPGGLSADAYLVGNTSMSRSFAGDIVSAPVEEARLDKNKEPPMDNPEGAPDVAGRDQEDLTQAEAAETDGLTEKSRHQFQQSEDPTVETPQQQQQPQLNQRQEQHDDLPNSEYPDLSSSFLESVQDGEVKEGPAPSLSISTLHSGDSQGAASAPEILEWKTPHAQMQQGSIPILTASNTEQDFMRLVSSPESEEWTRPLRALGSFAERKFQQNSPLTVEVTNLLHRTIKQDKQVQGLQVLLESMSQENHKLKKNSKHLDDKLADERAEKADLLEKIKHLELSQKKDVSENASKSDPTGWIHVEKQANVQNVAEQVVMLTDVDIQQRKIKQYEALIQEKEQGNQRLEEFCKKQLSDHENQVAGLRRDLAEMSQQKKRYQQEVESLRMKMRKKEEAEMERTALLQQLKTEKQKSQQQQQHYENERQEGRRLQRTVDSLRQQVAGHQEIISALQSENRSIRDNQQNQAVGGQVGLSLTPSVQPMPATMSEMETEILLLRQQIAIYKDDFDTERRDREQGQTIKNRLEEQLKKLYHDLSSSQKETRRKEDEINNLKTRMETGQKELQKRTEEFQLQLQQQQQVLQQQLQQHQHLQMRQMNMWPPAAPASNYHYNIPTPSSQQPPPYMNWGLPPPPTTAPTAKKSWYCKRCTFENIPERVTCEMCGERATNVTFGGTNMPTMVEVEQYNPEPRVGCQQHLIARTPHGNIECDANRARRSPRHLTVSSDPNDLVTDGGSQKETP